VLAERAPTVTLTRVQSGIGTLTIEAACSAEVGELRLGAAYRLTSGLTSVLDSGPGNRFAPPHSPYPVLVAGRERYERLALDLRHIRELDRLAVFAFAENREPLQWGGTLVVTTHSGARIEAALDGLSGAVAMLLTGFQVNGELTVRNEHESGFPTVREATRAFGYDAISWLDDRTPVE
jgi:hypothetical protein